MNRIEDARHLFQLGQLEPARRIALKLVKAGQRMADALQLLGYIAGRQDDLAAAASYLASAVKYAPDAAETWYYLGMAEQRRGRQAEAAAALERAVALVPDFFEAQHDLGLARHALQQFAEAQPAFDRAAELRPEAFAAQLNRGINLGALRRYAEELACYERALRLDERDERLLENMGQVLCQLGDFERAVPHYERMLALYPQHDVARGAALHAKMKIADWRGFDDELARVREAIAAQRDGIAPFALTGLPSTPAEQRAVAERFSRQFAATTPLEAPAARPAGSRLRVGYLSSDFREHPVAFAMARLFELHDRAAFEVIGLSIGAGDESPLRQRLEAGFDRFVDLHGLDDRALAQAIRALEIDLLIDLNGYTEHARPGALALRPAPLQLSYLGFPGTSGAPFIDYLIADEVVLPEADRPHCSEALILLPDAYQATDPTRAPDAAPWTRAEAGLPDDAFVFCCFNDAYKLTPSMFDLWMRLLARVDGSVLWLPSKSAAREERLRAEAAARRVDPARLVFAPYIPLPRHLRRLQLADLFLDTLPYNAHATASDALWAGLPLLTCTGDTFAGRVASSLLRAVGLPELATRTLDDYEALAVDLATDRARTAGLRERLAMLRTTSPLFDAARFARHFEQGLRLAWQRHAAGLGPAHIVVPQLLTA